MQICKTKNKRIPKIANRLKITNGVHVDNKQNNHVVVEELV